MPKNKYTELDKEYRDIDCRDGLIDFGEVSEVEKAIQEANEENREYSEVTGLKVCKIK